MAEHIGPITIGVTNGGTQQLLRSTGNLLINATNNTLSSLDDVSMNSFSNLQGLTYNSSISKWENKDMLFASSLNDVSITSPIDSDKLIYNSTLTKWVNSQPYYFNVIISGKFKDTFLSGSPSGYKNLLTNTATVFDSYSMDVSGSYGLSLDASNFIVGFRQNCIYSLEANMTLSMLTIANSAIFNFGICTSTQLGGGGSLAGVSQYCNLNQPSLTINMISTTTPYNLLLCPYIGISASSVYTGNATQDFSINCTIYEL